jgi:hypothetical protein
VAGSGTSVVVVMTVPDEGAELGACVVCGQGVADPGGGLRVACPRCVSVLRDRIQGRRDAELVRLNRGGRSS